MSKHTPGPWAVGRTVYPNIAILCKGNIVAEVRTYGVGMITEGETAPWHNAEANARLIAAAPELLEALRELLDQLEGIGIPEWAGAEGLSLEQATAAVYKAEGQTWPVEE